MEEKENLNIDKQKISTKKGINKGKIYIFITIIILLIFRWIFHLNIFLLILLFIIILIIIIKKLIQEFLEKAGYIESWHDLYGIKINNLPYFTNNKIRNSFKKNGENFKEDIGEINNGQDYEVNERNYYSLYIPYSSLKRKNKFNGIILFIHGGAWIGGKKEDIEYLCARYSKFGYITCTMNHTLLLKKYKNFNIFRIIDEISSCISSIKDYLKNLGFNENKLELALGGISSGAHLALLYGYSIKNCSIPIKFLIDIVGPLSFEPQYWYKVAKKDEVLESIEPEEIENALKEKRIIKVFEDDSAWVGMMNLFLGKKYTDDQLKEMVENKRIKTDNEKFQEMFKIVKNAFPVNFIDSNTVPTLCEYGGNDSLVGIGQYQYLKKLSEKYGNKLVLVYMKYGDHGLMNFDNENGLNAMREMHFQILTFAKTYFTHND